MAYRIQVSQEVAKYFGGRRRRTVATSEGPTSITFGVASVFLPWLPEEVANDEHLLVKEVSEEEMRLLGGSLLTLPAPPASSSAQQLQQVGSELGSPAQNPAGLADPFKLASEEAGQAELSQLEAPAQEPAEQVEPPQVAGASRKPSRSRRGR